MKLLRVFEATVGMLLILAGTATPVYAGAPLPGVPEIDPGSVMGALAVLSGGLLMVTDRLRRQ